MDILGAIAMLRRRWIVVVLCLVAGIGGGFDLGHHGPKTYRATAEMLVVTPRGQDVQEQLAGSQLSANLVVTYARLISSRDLLDRADTILSDKGVTTGARGLSANTVNSTYLIDVSATNVSPRIAQLTANAGAQALKQTVAKVQVGNIEKITVQITSPATLPTAPISPRPRLDLLVGLVLGLVAGLGLAALLESLDRTVKTAAHGDAAVGVPLIGIIPKRRGGLIVVTADDNSPKGEPYRSARTAIRFLDPDRPLRSILITSPSAGDGKTTTAVNLAAAFALSGDQILAVDADLRRPRLGEAFGVDSSVGLTSLVLRSASLDSALQEWSPRLSILPSGPLPPNPSEILGSQTVSTLIQDLVSRADITIIDAPPVLPVADSLALATQVDGVILVLRADSTGRHDAAEAARRLEAVGANVLGYVLNAVPRNEARGAYAYYAYGGAARLKAPVRRAVRTTVDEPRHVAVPPPTDAAEPLTPASSAPPLRRPSRRIADDAVARVNGAAARVVNGQSPQYGSTARSAAAARNGSEPRNGSTSRNGAENPSADVESEGPVR